MILETRIISKQEYQKYKNGSKTTSIHLIWENILQKLPGNLRIEAVEKGFTLREVDRSMDLINLLIEVPNATEELERAILNAWPFVVCE